MLQIVPAGSVWRDAALALLYAQLPPGERHEQLTLMRSAVATGEIPVDDLLIALINGRPAGAVLAVRRAGDMGFLWPPSTLDVGTDTARKLLAAVARQLDDAGIQFTQCLLEPDDARGRATLNEAGFLYYTDLLQLTRPVAEVTAAAEPRLSEIGYDLSSHALFVEVLERTFTDTRDCPALTRIRRGEQMLAAHRDSGQFDPTLWCVYHRDEEAVGLLLAVDHPERLAREIAYLGVVPEARGVGIGRAMLRDVMQRAVSTPCLSLEVAVDAGNTPALALYASGGFDERKRMAVHLRFRGDVGAAVE